MALTIVSANTPNRIPGDTRLARALKWMGRTLRRHSRRAPRRGLRPDSIGVQEGQGIIKALPLKGYRTVLDRHGEDQRRGAKDTLILTRRKWDSLGMAQVKATDTVPPERFAVERWISVSIFDHPQGSVAHVNFHDNARIMRGDRSDPGYREHLRLMRTLRRVLALCRLTSDHVVVTGDANWRRKADGPGQDVYDVFRDHGLVVWSHGVDLMAHSKSLRRVRKWYVAKGTFRGQDHAWLVGQFEGRRK